MERCDICETRVIKKIGSRQKTIHHLIPKWLRDEEDNNKTVILCRDCHRAFHKFVDFSELENKQYFVNKYFLYKEMFAKERQRYKNYVRKNTHHK